MYVCIYVCIYVCMYLCIDCTNIVEICSNILKQAGRDSNQISKGVTEMTKEAGRPSHALQSCAKQMVHLHGINPP